MKWKRRIHAKSVIIVWIISYAAVLLLPIITSSLLYMRTFDYLQNAAVKESISKNIAIQYQIDEVVHTLQQMSKEIAYADMTKDMVYQVENSSSHYNYIQFLRSFQKTYDKLEDIYVYFSKDDMVLSCTGSANSRAFYNGRLSYSEMSYENWIAGMKQSETSLMHFPGEDIRQGAASMALIRNIRTDGEGHVVTVVTTVSAQTLQDFIFFSSMDTGAHVAVTNEAGDIIAKSTEFSREKCNTNQEILLLPNVNRVKYDGEKSILLVSESMESNLRYWYVLPQDILQKELRSFRGLVWISIIVSILLGGWMIVFLVRKNYKPINHLVEMFRREQMTSEEENEFHIIENFIHKMEQRYKTKEEKQTHLLEQTYLTNLLTGNNMENNPEYEAIKKKYEKDWFAVLIFRPQDVINLFGESGNKRENEYLAHYILQNIFLELLEEKYEGEGLQYNDTTVFILTLNANDEDIDEDIYEKVEYCISYMEENFFVTYQAAVSNIHSSIYGITEAYNEALQALEFMMIVDGEESIIHYHDIQHDKKGYLYPMEYEQQLISTIRSGDYDNAARVMNKVEQENFSSNEFDVVLLKLLIIDVSASVVKALEQLDNSRYMTLKQQAHKKLGFILESKNIQEMRSVMYEMVRDSCEVFRLEKQSQTKEISTADIKQYIEENYADMLLNVSAVADHFSMNFSYLSRVFKEIEGVGLLEYINHLRAEQSLRYLWKEDNLEQVARKVGFSNAKTYTRVFKKYYGVTPGKYKEEHLEQSNS